MQGFYCIYPPIYSTKSNRATQNFNGNSASHFVGYQTVPVTKNKYHALAVQFRDVAASDGTVAVKDLFTSSNPKGWTSLNPRADQIHLWTGMAWQKYYFNSTLTAWVKDGESEETTDTVSNGDTFFFLRSMQGVNGDTITLSGSVTTVEPSSEVVVTKNKYHFIAYPWPVEFAVADFMKASSNPKGGTSLNPRADQVHRWTGMAWEKYYYNTTVGGYVKEGESEVTTAKLGVGEGVFFLRSMQGATGDKITFVKPAGL